MSTMEKGKLAPLWYVLIASLIVLALQDWLFHPRVDTISYGQFKTLVETRKVHDLTVGKNSVAGRVDLDGLDGVLPPERLAALRQSGAKDAQFSTVRVEDPELVGDLHRAGVDFSGEL